jgi:hypothetical protein
MRRKSIPFNCIQEVSLVDLRDAFVVFFFVRDLVPGKIPFDLTFHSFKDFVVEIHHFNILSSNNDL